MEITDYLLIIFPLLTGIISWIFAYKMSKNRMMMEVSLLKTEINKQLEIIKEIVESEKVLSSSVKSIEEEINTINSKLLKNQEDIEKFNDRKQKRDDTWKKYGTLLKDLAGTVLTETLRDPDKRKVAVEGVKVAGKKVGKAIGKAGVKMALHK